MRSAVPLFLLLLMVSVQTPVGQLLKMPLLIRHFVKHQNDEGMSVLGFVQEHYASSHTDEDQSDDEQLPFKANLTCNLGVATVPQTISADLVLPDFFERKIILQPTYSPQQHLNNIFHPPRM